MDELEKNAAELLRDINEARSKLKLDEAQSKLRTLQERMSQPGFWDEPQEAQKLSKQAADLNRRLEPWLRLRSETGELLALAKLKDDGMKAELQNQFQNTKTSFEALKHQLRFQGDYDEHDVILSIFAGAGGTDAQDWAQMLLRMYTRWAEAKGLKLKTLDSSSGEEAGIKSTTVEISGGEFLYGQLASEHGVHRLVRLSPFNADHLRQTSFAKVEIVPKIDQSDEPEINDKDLKIDVFRAGGHGGQSVNTTDSAVRVTHIPTGLSVSIQNERSQLQNKETALTILNSKLAQLRLEQRAKKVNELRGPAESAGWGNQIRSYVLHPYKQVKDLRTGYVSSEIEKILDGEIDPLLNAWLEHKSPA